jgi:hypothetical protein
MDDRFAHADPPGSGDSEKREQCSCLARVCVRQVIQARGMSSVSTVGDVMLDGIGLDIPDPQHYLRVLRPVVQHHHPEILPHVAEWAGLVGVAAEPPDRQSAMAVIGWCGDLICELIDREWAATRDNEFDVFAGYLASHGLIGAARSVLLYGAGTCRLGDFLISLDPHRTVVCSDLSSLMLYYGRALNEHRLDRLPPVSLAERTNYSVQCDPSPRLAMRRAPIAFKAPLSGDASRLRDSVRNAFAGASGPSTCDLVVLPYVLDCQRGHGVRTMLIRILQQVAISCCRRCAISWSVKSPSSRGRRGPDSTSSTRPTTRRSPPAIGTSICSSRRSPGRTVIASTSRLRCPTRWPSACRTPAAA